MADKKVIAGLIRDLRDRLGLSQEKLARELDVSLPTISRWERGAVEPDPPGLRALEQLLRGRGHKFADLHSRLLEWQVPTVGDSHDVLRVGVDSPGAVVAGSAPSKSIPINGALLDTRVMESFLWRAACSIRGEKDAPKFKDYILPLIFLKRLSDVFDDEMQGLAAKFGSEATAQSVVDEDHELVRFFIPEEARWPVLSGRKKYDWPEGTRPKTLGEHVTQAVRCVARENPTLQGVIDIVDYNETRNGEREISDEALGRLIELFSNKQFRLGLRDVEPDFLGRAYEYLLRKFAEGQGQSAGEFFTPKEVGWLIARLMNARQGEEIYDPCCGSAGLLIKCQLELKEREGELGHPPTLYGQELMASSFAIARMNMVIHDMRGEIVRGNSMTNPKYLDGSSLKRFDVIVTNPMWNQDNFDPASYENDPFERFGERGGFSPGSSADWAWIQHVQASLKDTGRAAIVIDTGAASRGSGSKTDNREKAIRRWFIERDLIEGVILLPENLFYNTTAAGLVIILNCRKPEERRGKAILVHAGADFEKGRPKNFIPDESIRKIAAAFHAGVDVERFVKVVNSEELAKNDFNLSPSRYIGIAPPVEHRDIQTLLDELRQMRGEAERSDGELKTIFETLGYKWDPETGPPGSEGRNSEEGAS